MTDLKVGQHVAFRHTGIRRGIITETGVTKKRQVGRGGYFPDVVTHDNVTIEGTEGDKGVTVQPRYAVRIPGPDEVIVSKAELEELREDSRFLSRLQAAGVDNWDGYEFACSEGDDD